MVYLILPLARHRQHLRVFDWDPIRGSHQGQRPGRVNELDTRPAPDRKLYIAPTCNAVAVHTWPYGQRPGRLRLFLAEIQNSRSVLKQRGRAQALQVLADQRRPRPEGHRSAVAACGPSRRR
jgi:hypothetical protein